MKEKKNKKVCWNCEADVDKDSLYCLYCGMDLSKQRESAASLVEAKKEEFFSVGGADSSLNRAEIAETSSEEQVKAVAPRNGTLAAALLCGGSLLLLFSLFLLLFSHEGVLKLVWDASLWFIYMFGAVVMLIFGYKSLRSLS